MELAIDLNTMDASQLARLYILLKETRQGFTAALVRDYGISNCIRQAGISNAGKSEWDKAVLQAQS